MSYVSKQNIEPVIVNKEPDRNEPCPCGSGKKYKKCCYLTKKVFRYDPEEKQRLLNKLIRSCERVAEYKKLFDEEVGPILKQWNEKFGEVRAEMAEHLLEAVTFEGMIGNHTLAELGAELISTKDKDKEKLGQLVEASFFAYFIVKQVVLGESLLITDLITENEYLCYENSASFQLRPGQILATRIIPCEANWQFTGRLMPVEPEAAKKLKKLYKKYGEDARMTQRMHLCLVTGVDDMTEKDKVEDELVRAGEYLLGGEPGKLLDIYEGLWTKVEKLLATDYYYVNIGIALSMMGMVDLANKWFDKALAEDPGNRFLVKKIKKLKERGLGYFSKADKIRMLWEYTFEKWGKLVIDGHKLEAIPRAIEEYVGMVEREEIKLTPKTKTMTFKSLVKLANQLKRHNLIGINPGLVLNVARDLGLVKEYRVTNVGRKWASLNSDMRWTECLKWVIRIKIGTLKLVPIAVLASEPDKRERNLNEIAREYKKYWERTGGWRKETIDWIKWVAFSDLEALGLVSAKEKDNVEVTELGIATWREIERTCKDALPTFLTT